MKELDEATLRDHVRRRAGETPDRGVADRLAAAVQTRVGEVRQGSTPLSAGWAIAPMRARLALTAALVVAISLIAVPLAGGPLPSASSSAPPSSADPSVLQELSLSELQRVVALGDTQPYVDRIVVADVDVAPPPAEAIPGCIPGCPGSVVGSSPRIMVYTPSADTDILRPTIPDAGLGGPVILRIQGVNEVELIGAAPMDVGGVAWPVRSFITAVDRMPRTMEFAPNRFTVGPAFVVDTKLASGAGYFCTLETPSEQRIAEFQCGVTGWLAPVDVEPTTILDGSSGHPADWVRVQNGAYQHFAAAESSPDATPGTEPVRGFYVVIPVLKYNATMCFQCDAGAVAILYGRLEPVPIPSGSAACSRAMPAMISASSRGFDHMTQWLVGRST
jgi:hypothetical protein